MCLIKGIRRPAGICDMSAIARLVTLPGVMTRPLQSLDFSVNQPVRTIQKRGVRSDYCPAPLVGVSRRLTEAARHLEECSRPGETLRTGEGLKTRFLTNALLVESGLQTVVVAKHTSLSFCSRRSGVGTKNVHF